MSEETIWVSDLAGVQICALVDHEGLTIEDRLGEVSSIEFSIRADDPRAGLLLPDMGLKWRDRYFRVFELRQTRSSSGAMVEVYGEALWTDLGRKVKFANLPVLGLKPQEGLVLILKGSGWSAGDDPAPSGTDLYSREGYDESVLTHLVEWAAVTGYELDFDEAAKTVSLVTAVGQDRGVGFRYGSNVESILRRYEPPRATVLYPVGANDLTIAGVNPSGENYVEDFSWYIAQGLTASQASNLHTKTEVWLDESYLVALNLYDRAVERLADLAQPIISYECRVVDLAKAVGGSGLVFEIGDTVSVRDELFDVDLKTRIVRRVYRPTTPGGDEVELSYLRTTLRSPGSAARSPDYGKTAILIDSNATEETVSASAVDFAEISLTSTGTATAVTGATFIGTASGTGTVRLQMISDAITVGGVYEVDFVDGELVEFSFPSYVADMEEGSHLVAWRAQIISGAGTITLPVDQGRAWLMIQGAYGLGVDTSPNRRIVEEILALVLLTETDSFTATLTTAIDVDAEIAETETVLGAADIGTVSETIILPFQIGDPVFGKLGGVGALS